MVFHCDKQLYKVSGRPPDREACITASIYPDTLSLSLCEVDTAKLTVDWYPQDFELNSKPTGTSRTLSGTYSREVIQQSSTSCFSRPCKALKWSLYALEWFGGERVFTLQFLTAM